MRRRRIRERERVMKRGVVAVLSAVLLIVTMALAPVSAQEPSQATILASNDEVDVLQQGNWILWNFHEELPNAEIVERSGQPTSDGGCVFAEESISDGSTMQGYFRIYREIAYNEVKCVVRYAVANLPLERLSEFDGSSEDGTEVGVEFEPSTVPASVDSRAGDAIYRAATSTTSTAWYETVYRDPVQLKVNYVKVNLSWTWDGSCVTASSNHTATWYYFSGTGWYLQSSSGSAARNCTYAATQASGLFYNYTWGDDSLLTWTNHHNTTIYGYADGSIGRYDSLTKGGEDANLLHTDFICSWTSC